jgi:hypothetical protein
MKPLLGSWISTPDAQESRMPALCHRTLTVFGKGWINLEAVWNVGGGREYRESAMFGAMPDGTLGFYSFTSDGKRSEGHLSDGSDVHATAIAFEAEMPAGRARMVYWPLNSGFGFNFAVESRTTKGWNRFLRHEYRPATGTKD